MTVDGLKIILRGLFKKIVVADNCAQNPNLFFNNSENYGDRSLYIGALFFNFPEYYTLYIMMWP
jgi:D-alanyl-lipoteichoic acid acyltransferase DltB (MBOAT superfamily)